MKKGEKFKPDMLDSEEIQEKMFELIASCLNVNIVIFTQRHEVIFSNNLNTV